MILYGASGHSKVVLDILMENGIEVDMVIDDHPKVDDIFGVAVQKKSSIDFSSDGFSASAFQNSIS